MLAEVRFQTDSWSTGPLMAALGATLLGGLLCAPVAAQVIARYDLDIASNGTVAPVTETSPSVTASDYAAALGTISGSTSTHFINGSLLTETLAQVAEFTVTPTVGSLNLTSLDFGFRSDGAEPEDVFDLVVRSSVDAFASDVFSESRTGTTGSD